MKKIFKIMRMLAKRYGEHNLGAYSAQLAYFFTLSIFPFLIFLFAIVGKLSLAVDDFDVYLSAFVPQEPALLITTYIRELLAVNSDSVLSISILFSLLSASKAFHALERSLNVSYSVKETRNYIEKRILGMVYTIFFTLSIIFALALPPMGTKFFDFIGRYVDLSFVNVDLITFMRWIFVVSFIGIIISSIYYFMPNIKLKYKEVLPGTLFAIIGWMSISIGFSYFINNFGRFSIIYGSLTAIVVFMIWLYLTGIILMAGGELNCLLREMKIAEELIMKSKKTNS